MVIKIPLNSTWKAKIGHFQVKEQFSELFWDSILFLKLSSPKTLVTVAPARQNNGRQRWRSEDERRIIGSVFVIWSQRADRHRRAHPDWTRNGCNCCLPHRRRSFECECWWPSAMRSASCEGLEWKCQHQIRYPSCSSVTHCSFTVHTATNPGSHCKQPFSFNEVFQSEFARFASRNDDSASRARGNVRRKSTPKSPWGGALNAEVLIVRCRNETAELYKNKLGSGGRGKCIKVRIFSNSTLFHLALIN